MELNRLIELEPETLFVCLKRRHVSDGRLEILPAGVMVARVTLDHSVEVRILGGEIEKPLGNQGFFYFGT